MAIAITALVICLVVGGLFVGSLFRRDAFEGPFLYALLLGCTPIPWLLGMLISGLL